MFLPLIASADTTNYYWKDGAGNGRWDWASDQWFIDGGSSVGVPRSDGGAILFFQGTGSTNTFINSGFSSGLFNLNSIILDSGSSGRNYTITAENGGSGIQLFNKIETQTGGGSVTVNGTTQFGSDSSINAFGGTITLGTVQQNGKTLTVDGGSNTSFGDVINGPGTGSIQKNGNETLTLGGSADNLNASVTVNAGTVILNKASSGGVHAVGSGLTVNNNGTVILAGTGGDQIYSGSLVTIQNGGTFKTNALSEGASSVGAMAGVGALTLQGGSTIDFAAGANGSTLSASSGSMNGAGTISILHWTGTGLTDDGSATNDRLLYQSDPNFTSGQLSQFQFYDDSGNAFATGGMAITYNGFTEIVPVPELSTSVAAFLALGVLVLTRRSIFSRKRL